VQSPYNPLIEDYNGIFYMIDEGDNRAYSTHWEKETAYRFSVRKSAEKRSLRRHIRLWEDNIKVEFEICMGGYRLNYLGLG
jgi:hypothetical protein